jgi:kynurenine formamidase
MKDLLQQLQQRRVIDLAQPWHVGMPHWPAHPPFLYSLSKMHGEMVLPGGASSAADAIALGTHTGTHIDALCHFSCDGRLHDGVVAAPLQSYGGGLERYSIDTVPLILRRAVFFDIAAREGVETLAEDFTITAAHLAAAAPASLNPGDIALVRTGWARRFAEPKLYVNEMRQPGIDLSGARWLSDQGIFAAGSDNVALERIPSPRMEVHVHLLVECGIHIMEVLNLEALHEERVSEMLFVAAPLKIRGATGSPIRPFALC